MKVCHVCSGHTADDGRVFHRTCASLAEIGYEVHLIARAKGEQPYKKKGVTIHPLPEAKSRGERLARRSHIARLASQLEPDLFHVHEPELLGQVVARATSRPVVWDAHESYLDIVMQREWIPLPLRPIARILWDWRESQLVRMCAGVVAVTEKVAERYRQLHSRVCVLNNYSDFAEVESLPPVVRDGKTCVFMGLLVQDRGLEFVIKALGLLKEKGLEVPLKLSGFITDTYLKKLLALANSLNLSKLVTFHGLTPRSEGLSFQNGGSIGLVCYLPTKNNLASMPNKLFECMALGLPVVFSDFANYSEIVGKTGAGIAVDPTNPAQIADGIERLVEDQSLALRMGEAGQNAVRQRFNWRTERVKLFDLYSAILQKPDKLNLKLRTDLVTQRA